MAIVPFRVSGAAADQSAELRILQFGQFTLELSQDPEKSGSSRTTLRNADESAGDVSDRRGGLQNVGLVVWQSGFLLADFLLRQPPFGGWAGVRVVDLGAGTGVVGIALAKAGASVTLSDLAHITPLTAQNVAQNQLTRSCRVVTHQWGEPLWEMECSPDVVTGADLLYEPESYQLLLATLSALVGPHTLLYLSFRSRAREDMGFKALLEAQGFWVRAVDSSSFHPEFQDDICSAGLGRLTPCSYHILAAQKLG